MLVNQCMRQYGCVCTEGTQYYNNDMITVFLQIDELQT